MSIATIAAVLACCFAGFVVGFMLGLWICRPMHRDASRFLSEARSAADNAKTCEDESDRILVEAKVRLARIDDLLERVSARPLGLPAPPEEEGV